MKERVPTIKEIAQQLNVSVSTVSRALSDHPRIGLRTKTRVKELAKKLNYEPNAKAIFFKQKKSFIIGVVLPFIKEDFFSEAISGIEKAALDHDYTILFGQSYDELDREIKVVEAMKRQRVDGMIISLAKQTQNFEHLQALDKYNIPVVYFDRVPSFDNVHKVYCDIYKGTISMINWLYQKGHRRIALINGPDRLSASKERLDGYIQGISAKRIKVNMSYVEQTDFSSDSTVEAMKNLLKQKTPPDAVITFNEYVHMDAVRYAEQAKVKVNEDIVFVSYANLPITMYTAHPPRASFEQYPYRQGERAMEIMIEILNRKNEENNTEEKFFQEELEGSLILHE